jgi:hypothetical protein
MDNTANLSNIHRELQHSGFPNRQKLLQFTKVLGYGCEGTVFCLGEQYALKIPYLYVHENLSKLKLHYIEDDFPGEEVGQARYMLGYNIPIMNKLKGFTGSFSYWRAPRYSGTNDIHLTKDFAMRTSPVLSH